MAYTKVYERINWRNRADGLITPLDRINLNKTDYAINELDNRIIEQEALKANQSTVLETLCGWNLDEETGIITVTKQSGEKIVFDLNIEKIPVSFALSKDGVLTMTTEDGTEFTADIGSMIPVLTFETTDTIGVSVGGSGGNKTYSFFVKDGSITASKLQPDYLADVTVQAQQASASMSTAMEYRDGAAYDAKLAQSYAIGLSGIREGEDTDNAKYYKEQAGATATSVNVSASNAFDSATEAAASATNAADSASTAGTKAGEAAISAATATNKASEASTSAADAADSAASASTSASNASASANNASTHAIKSQSYAVGGTGSRTGEETDNAEYFYNQAKAISESFAGSLRPMGTVDFASLPSLSSATAGDMYNVSDEFVTTGDFKEGEGYTEPAGSNVYKTADGYWDILAGTPVTGVKGAAENTFRRGNVNLTPTDIGALAQDGIAASAKKLEASAGSGTSPVYFANGQPTPCTYTLGKSVPSSAVLTDTWKQNTATSEGYVPATGRKANAFYATDSAGTPGWRDIYPIDADASVSFQEIGTCAFNVIDAGTYNRSWADCRMFHVRIGWVGSYQPSAETYLKLDNNYYLMIMPGYDAYSIPVVYDSLLPELKIGAVLQIYLDSNLMTDDEGDGGLGQPEYTAAAGYAVYANTHVLSTSSYKVSSYEMLATAKAVNDLYLEHCQHSLGTLGTAAQTMTITGQSKEPVTISITCCNSDGVIKGLAACRIVHDGSSAWMAAITALSSTYGTIINGGEDGIKVTNKSGYYLHVFAIGACSAVIS